MKVSVIVFTHNTPKQLEAFKAMLQLQTHTDWELIIMDESDKFGFNKKIKNTSTYHEKWKQDWGQTSKHKAAKEYAKGEILAFPNDDTYWTPHFLKKCVNKTEEGHDLVLTDWIHGMSDGEGYNQVTAQPQLGSVDIGGFTIKKDKFLECEWKVKNNQGDANLIKELLQKGARWTKIKGVHYIKN